MKKSLGIGIIIIAVIAVFMFANEDKQFGQNKKGTVLWEYDQEKKVWEPSSEPPICPELEFESPVDVAKVTSILYPGQYRGEGGGYRAHGGFRFDRQKTTEMEVRAPFDGYVLRGSRYFVNGTIQYVFDVVHPCGIMYRLGHLLELAPNFQALSDKLPPPKEGDSRDHRTENIFVPKGDLIATRVGLEGNVFVDWGVYDLRSQNEVSKNTAYRNEHGWMGAFAFYSMCWLDYLPPQQKTVVKSLPGGDLKMGKKSDYCGT